MSRLIARFAEYSMLWLALMIVVISTAIFVPGTLTLANANAIFTFGVPIGLLALGETVVILSGGGGIDLSVGSMMALSQVIAAVSTNVHSAPFLLIGIGVVSGVLMGAINGLIVTKLAIPAFITTLATMFAFSGIALLLSHGIDISTLPPAFAVFGQGMVAYLPLQMVVIYLPLALGLWYVLEKTIFGYAIYYVGTNEKAALLSGIRVSATRIGAYMISGFFASVAGVVQASWLGTARPDAGSVANLLAITITVLGGTSLLGGRGSVLGTMLATLVITVLGFSFNLANINSVIETGTVGVFLIVVVLGQRLLSERQGVQKH